MGRSSGILRPSVPSSGRTSRTLHPACDAAGRLEERKRLVTTFYFYEGLTLKEIGRALNLTKGRVSQIHKRALTRLQDIIEEPSSLA